MKNCNYVIGNRTRDLLAFSAMSQPTAPPRAPKKYPAFYGTRKFIIAFTSSRNLPLSRASSIQSIPLHPTFWKCILTLSSHLCLGLPSGHFPSGFPTKTLYTPLLSPYALHAPPISFFSILSPEQYWASSTDHCTIICLTFRHRASSI